MFCHRILNTVPRAAIIYIYIYTHTHTHIYFFLIWSLYNPVLKNSNVKFLYVLRKRLMYLVLKEYQVRERLECEPRNKNSQLKKVFNIDIKWPLFFPRLNPVIARGQPTCTLWDWKHSLKLLTTRADLLWNLQLYLGMHINLYSPPEPSCVCVF